MLVIHFISIYVSFHTDIEWPFWLRRKEVLHSELLICTLRVPPSLPRTKELGKGETLELHKFTAIEMLVHRANVINVCT